MSQCIYWPDKTGKEQMCGSCSEDCECGALDNVTKFSSCFDMARQFPLQVRDRLYASLVTTGQYPLAVMINDAKRI